MEPVYKYYKACRALSVLKDLLIYTSAPAQLNDPFELSPNITPTQFSQAAGEKFLREKEQIDHWYKIDGPKHGFTNKKRFKDWYLKDIPRRVADLLPNVPANVEQTKQNFAHTLGHFWRLFCASKVRDSILMWSHYADEHNGIVIQFNRSEPPFSHVASDYFLSVKYSNKKADFIHGNDSRAILSLLQVASTKAKTWEYEQEVRFLIPAASKELRGNFLPIRPSCITEVYFGCRASAKHIDPVLTILRDPKFAHVEVFRAELHPSEYGLVFKRFPFRPVE